MTKRAMHLMGLFAAAAVLAACGGGSGNGADPVAGPGPAPAPAPAPAPPPAPAPAPAPAPPPPSASAAPILFVTQAPFGGDSFEKITGNFANHLPGPHAAPRGGDLWIAYPSASGGPAQLRNLTAEAGFGNDIAVRDPSVHWNGQKALVSLVVGSGDAAFWQVYEVSGLGQGEAVAFKRLPQPANYNLISPVYDPQGGVLTVTDIPRSGPADRHLYPQLDEYEEAPTTTGLWRLDPASGLVKLLHHAPSGSFRPQVDSFGRVVFTNWDHPQRDQQAGDPQQGLFDFGDESPNAATFPEGSTQSPIAEVFPEPFGTSGCANGISRHTFNFFLPWMVNLDGTGAETLNHIGRHELGLFGPASRVTSGCQPAFGLQPLVGAQGVNAPLVDTGMKLGAFHYLREDPRPAFRGTYYAVNAPEFGSHGAGCIVTLQGAPTLRPHEMAVALLTPPATCGNGGPALYRSPLPMSDGRLLATVSTRTRTAPSGDTSPPGEVYDFRLKFLKKVNGSHQPDAPLTPGIVERINGTDVTMWEWDAVEVAPRALPAATAMEPLASPEQQAFNAAQVDVQAFRQFLQAHQLALITMRDVTVRDGFDRSQPFNLRVPSSGHQSTGSADTVFDIDHFQVFQADQLRGVKNDPARGRRVLAQPVKPRAVNGRPVNPPAPGAPQGSVKVGADGSVAAIVPADRALIWQLVDSHKPGDPKLGTDGVVRERVWVSFRPGEIRTCANCHGVSQKDQRGQPFDSVVNTPEALKSLLLHYKAQFGAAQAARSGQGGK